MYADRHIKLQMQRFEQAKNNIEMLTGTIANKPLSAQLALIEELCRWRSQLLAAQQMLLNAERTNSLKIFIAGTKMRLLDPESLKHEPATC